MPIDLSVIIPAYNEEKSIESCILSIIKALSDRQLSFEIIPVDDGSKDRTLDILRNLAKNDARIRPFTNGQNRGKGFTVRHGVLESQGQLVLFTDVDMSTPITELDKLKAAMDTGYEIAIGSRALSDSTCKIHQPWYRIILGRLANLAIQSIVPALKGIKDTQCGFKLFAGDAARRIFPMQTNERWGFDFEVLHIARKFGYRVIEIPITWSHSGESHIRLSDYPKTLGELIKVRRNEMKGLYKTDL